MTPEVMTAPFLIGFASLTALAAVRDITSYTIPNWIPAVLALSFPAAGLAGGLPLADIGVGLLLGAGFLVIGIVMFALNWVGGGDAKLLAAVAIWLGLPALPIFIFGTALAGGMLSLVLLGMRSVWLRPFLLGRGAWVERLATPGAATPYGVAIAMGALFSMFTGAMPLAHFLRP